MSSEQEPIRVHTRPLHQQRPDKKERAHPDGKRIHPQLPCTLPHPKQRPKIDTPASRDPPSSDTFRQLLSRRDRNKQSQSKMQHRVHRRPEDPGQDRTAHNKSHSKSKSKSKGMGKSKSLKQLVKKSKSMARLDARQKGGKQQRKSESPQRHIKSTTIVVERKHCKSSYNSKTNRDFLSELTTERDKSKGKMKMSQISKPSSKKGKKSEEKKKTNSKVLIKLNEKKPSEKENSKQEGKEKKTRPKSKKEKEKQVIISEENSKVKRHQEWEVSLLQDEFLDPKQPRNKPRQKEVNMVDLPKRKERLSLNSNSKRHHLSKNTKTEAEIEQFRSRLKQIQHSAAVTIQKVFRGYLTRKYIRECIQHNAAVNIQRLWRGHRGRIIALKERLKHSEANNPSSSQSGIRESAGKGIFEQEEYLLQRSSSREEDVRSNHNYTERWASILEEILSEESVNQNIKKKIQNFLENQRREMTQFEFRSNPSARSSLSSQVVNNQINSERHFLAQQRLRKEHPHTLNSPLPHSLSPAHLIKSPSTFPYNSLPSFPYNSPQPCLSPRINSPELLIQSLKNIQKFHKERLHNKASSEKEELNSMLIRNKLSPRTHEKKYKEVESCLESELEKFNQSINEIVKNCIIYKQESPQLHPHENSLDFSPELMITPKKHLVELSLPELPEETCSPKLKARDPDPSFRKQDERSLEFCEYYQTQREELKRQDSSYDSFDTSYHFIEEYLMGLIEFLRLYDNGNYASRILALLHKPRSHQPQTILRNLKTVTENSEEEDEENSFRLPLYKYIDLDEEMIEGAVVDEFNASFEKLKNSLSSNGRQLRAYFLKMIAQCMNEALNSLRPAEYIFTNTHLVAVNRLKSLLKLPQFDSDDYSLEEMQHQLMFAQVMIKIFYLNQFEWGKAISLRQEDDNAENRCFLLKKQEESVAKVEAAEPWEFYEELVELIGQLSEELFQLLLCEEIGEIWMMIFSRNSRNLPTKAPNLTLAAEAAHLFLLP